MLASISPREVELVEYNDEVGALRDAYIAAGMGSAASAADAEHIAAASAEEVDFIVSWNFKHIVHYEKISGYQAINLLHGYKPIRIYSPKEVVSG